VGVFHDEAELAEHIARSPYGQQAAISPTSPLHLPYISPTSPYISPYAQQAAIFTRSAAAAAPLVDVLATAVGRVNLNTQCGRSPDELPFSGRRSSALGTMSVSEALRAFSTESVVAGKATQPSNPQLAEELPRLSKFMRAVS